MNLLGGFNHARDRRSLKHRYAEAQAQIGPIAEAAYKNEGLTRQRVERIEAFLDSSAWNKLKWLLTGK